MKIIFKIIIGVFVLLIIITLIILLLLFFYQQNVDIQLDNLNVGNLTGNIQQFSLPINGTIQVFNHNFYDIYLVNGEAIGKHPNYNGTLWTATLEKNMNLYSKVETIVPFTSLLTYEDIYDKSGSFFRELSSNCTLNQTGNFNNSQSTSLYLIIDVHCQVKVAGIQFTRNMQFSQNVPCTR